MMNNDQLLQYLESPEGARKFALSKKLAKSLVSDGMDKQIVDRILWSNLLASSTNLESIEEFLPTLPLIKQSIITSHHYEESTEAAYQRAGATVAVARHKKENQQNSHPLAPESSVTSQQLHQYLESPEGARKVDYSRRMFKSLVSDGMDEQIVYRILWLHLEASSTKQESIMEFFDNLCFIEQSLITSHYYEESREEVFQRVLKTFDAVMYIMPDRGRYAFLEDRTPEPEPEIETEPETEAELETDIEAEAEAEAGAETKAEGELETATETETEIEIQTEVDSEAVLQDQVTEIVDTQIISEPVLQDPVFKFVDPLTGSEPIRFEGVLEPFDSLTNPNQVFAGTVSEFIEPDPFAFSGGKGMVIEPIDGLQRFSTDMSAEFSEEQLQADLVNSMAVSTEVLA